MDSLQLPAGKPTPSTSRASLFPASEWNQRPSRRLCPRQSSFALPSPKSCAGRFVTYSHEDLFLAFFRLFRGCKQPHALAGSRQLAIVTIEILRIGELV